MLVLNLAIFPDALALFPLSVLHGYNCAHVPTGADSLVHVSQDSLPGDAFALSLNKVWEVIKSQKDLNLPAHKVCCSLPREAL